MDFVETRVLLKILALKIHAPMEEIVSKSVVMYLTTTAIVQFSLLERTAQKK